MKIPKRVIKNLPPVCQLTASVVDAWGGKAYLVGGLVRDLLLDAGALSLGNRDWDIAVDLRSTGKGLLGLLKELQNRTGGKYVFHHQFLTGTLMLSELRVDIAHTREENYPQPAVLPEIRPAGIEADLRRRDFTVNALALVLSGPEKGIVIDPTGGTVDLKHHLIRIIHPISFIDDPTRIFRAIRFAVRFGFEIESGTLHLMRQAIAAGYPARLTPERILYELRCICRERSALKMLEAVIREGVLTACFSKSSGPEFFGVPVKQVLNELAALVRSGAGEELLMIYLLSRLPVNERFPITREERVAREALVNSAVLLERLSRMRRRSSIYQLLRGVPVPTLKILAVLSSAPDRSRLRLFLQELIHVQPQLQAADLIAAGVKPGPEMGRILERLLVARLDRRVKNRDEELAFVHRLQSSNV